MNGTPGEQGSQVSEEKRRRRGSKGSATTAASTSPMPPPILPSTPADIPVDPHGLPDFDLEGNEGNMEFDPELHDYHQAIPAPTLSPIIEDADGEAREREAKRQRVREEGHHANFAKEESCEAYLAAEGGRYLDEKVVKHYAQHEHAYQTLGVSEGDLLFGVHRNDFQKQYEALAVTNPNDSGAKKKGRKEILLKDLDAEQRELFCGKGGSDEKEWSAWKTKDACDIVSPELSEKVRREKPDLIIPTRWFLAKSRLVVQGFKDKSLGRFRRDAPTASAVAESICLAVCAFFKFTLFAKDIKNAYFSGKSVDREIYLEQPRGGLPGLLPGQLLQAKKAIYGFAEAARLFWLALREHLLSDGWVESKLEPALFYLRQQGRLVGILVTHVDDLEGGVNEKVINSAFERSARALEFATNHYKDFIFRGREVRQNEHNHIDVSMKNYALSMKTVKVDSGRRKELRSELTPEELSVFQSSAGELGWTTRQLRCDLAYENGVVQRSKTDTCVADLLLLKQYIGLARRGANFRQRYWSDVDLESGVILHLADSGHANGTPDHNEELKYRSVGGYFIMIANPEILKGEEARANILAYHSTLTKRVCRSTLAAEASHLAEAVEAGDWIIVLMEEALTGYVDLKNWDKIIEQRKRAYVTDARSVYDYLQRDATSTSSDKRMAIEGALLRETVRRDRAYVKWIDGQQNIANVLTKANAEKDILRDFLRTGLLCLTQTEANRALKERKQQQRQQRKKVKDEHQYRKAHLRALRREDVAKQVEGMELMDDNLTDNEKKIEECENSP